MVTTRMTVEEHAKQLVSHGAHAADIEVVEGLLAELEKSKKTIESLRELTRKQFGLVQLSEPLSMNGCGLLAIPSDTPMHSARHPLG